MREKYDVDSTVACSMQITSHPSESLHIYTNYVAFIVDVATTRVMGGRTGTCPVTYLQLADIPLSFSQLDIQGGPKKPDCFSELITLRRLVVEMRVICQNLANFI